MMSVHSEVAADQACHVVQTFLAGNYVRSELLVQQSTCCCQVIHLSAGFDNSCRTIRICRFFRRNTFGYRYVSFTSISCCSDNFTEVYVAGSRKHIYAIFTTLHVRTTCDQIMVQIEYILHQIISVVIIIAIFR